MVKNESSNKGNIAKHMMCMLLSIILSITSINNVSAQKYNMTYLYGSDDYISLINHTQDTLNEISPSYFDIDKSGNLILNTVDTNLVNEMHEDGIKVVPFLSNHWDREVGRAGLLNRQKLSTDIANAINKYNLDGVNVDIENVTEVDRASYVDLVRLLREKIPSNKSVVVSVAANPYNLNTGWQGSYDYEKLAKHADYLMIMAYDEHYESGTEGPVASISFVEKSIEYAISKVPKEKIVLGIPLYGRYWQNGASYGGLAVSLEKTEELVKNYKSTVTYDDASKSVKAVITIQNSDSKPKIYGKTLNAGTYTIWYENEASVRAKLELINKYDVKGAGTWRLGLEVKSIWDTFKEILASKENVFNDVSDSHWASEAISYIKEKGIIEGKTEKLYKPDDSLTRAELSAIICRMLNLGNENTQNLYKDTTGHWAEKYILSISKLGIVEGYGNGLFKPDKNVTRAEVAKIISKAIKLTDRQYDEKAIQQFSDVSSKHWAIEYINELARKGIITGYSDGSYKAERNVTRAEIAQIIYKALDK